MSDIPDGADRARAAAGRRRAHRDRESESRDGGDERQRADAPLDALAVLLEETAGAVSGVDPAARLCALFREVSRAGAALLLRHRGDGGEFAVRAACGLDDAADRGSMLALARRVATWAATTRKPLLVTDPARDLRFRECAPDRVTVVEGFALEAWGRPAGAIVLLWSAESAAPDPEAWARRRRVLAAAAALVLGLDALAAEAEASRRRLADTEVLRRRDERRLAAAEMLEETGSEAEGVLDGLESLVERATGESDAESHRALLGLAAEHVRRLRRLHRRLLETGRPEAERRAAVDLNEILEAAVQEGDPAAIARRVRLRARYGASVPPLVVDAPRFRRAFALILGRLIERAPSSGRVRVESVRRGDVVEIRFLADGPRDAGFPLDLLWTPLGGRERGGSETVAALLERHEGRVAARFDAEWGIVAELTLPIAPHRDRRAGRDRRGRDRRAA